MKDRATKLFKKGLEYINKKNNDNSKVGRALYTRQDISHIKITRTETVLFRRVTKSTK